MRYMLQVRFGNALAAQDALPPHEREAIFAAYRAVARTPGVLDVPGPELADRAHALLGNGAAFLHAHFAGPGCFAFRMDRAA